MKRNDQRSRTKAFRIAVSQSGVESAAIHEGENYELEVVGEHIDAVVLTKCLRKKLNHAHLVSVGPVASDDNNAAASSDARPIVSPVMETQPQPNSNRDVPQYQVFEVRDPNPECCSIM